MKIKNIVTILLVAFILASCAPAVKVVPTETAVPASTITPIPSTPTITPTPAPENITDAKDFSIWIDDFIHAYENEVTVNNVKMNASQLTDEIKKNPEMFIQTARVNGIETSFLVVNKIPLAMMGNDNIWKDIGYKDLAPQRMTVGASFAVWTGDYDDDPRYREVFLKNFNLAATDGSLSEYDLLGKMYDLPKGTKFTLDEVMANFNWKDFDKIASFMKENNIPLRAQHLLATYPQEYVDETLDWMNQLGNDDLQKFVDGEMTSILDRYQFAEASFANESFWVDGIPDNNFYYRRFGKNYIENAYNVAHTASPETTLILNDNLTYFDQDGSYPGGVNVINKEARIIYQYIKQSRAQGILIGAAGIESHLVASDFINGDVDVEKMKQGTIDYMAQYADIGVDVYITELDIRIDTLPDDWSQIMREELKAKIYKAIFEACLQSENCKSVTTWGFSNTASWIVVNEAVDGIKVSPLPLDVNYRPLPASYAIKQALFEHWVQP
jgi:GH35 family endo-1,4-beta-xylanase